MRIEILIRVDIYPVSNDVLSAAIDNIVEEVKREFPELYFPTMASPVVVTIRRDEESKESK